MVREGASGRCFLYKVRRFFFFFVFVEFSVSEFWLKCFTVYS
jgi:hypothetical protein